MKKKISALLAVLLLVGSFASCKKADTTSSNTDSSDIISSEDSENSSAENIGSSEEVSSDEASSDEVSSTESSRPGSKPSKPSEPSKPSKPSKPSESSKPASKPGSSSDSSTDNSSDANKPYDVSKDAFYHKKPIYCTWLNVWEGSTEFWWSPISSSGIEIDYGNIKTDTKSLDWTDPVLQKYYMDQVKDAGINAVIMDLTNGISWENACFAIADYVSKNGMKYAAGINAYKMDDLELKAQMIYDLYAGPETEYGSSYLYKGNKPLLVLYTGMEHWDNIFNQGRFDSGILSKFTVVWSSGENSRKDKWGWQAPAKDGPQESSDVMFVTSSINWTAPTFSMTGWRRHLAYLDYGFMLARKNNPKYIVVNSFDDMRERHGWIKADTSKASFNFNVLKENFWNIDNAGTPGLIRRDVYGKMSTDAYYNRTKALINKTAKAYVAGGKLKDGVYLIKNASNGKGITSQNPSAHDAQNNPARLDWTNDRVGVEAKLQSNPSYQQYYFLYHLGNQEYRLVRLCIGLSLEDKNGKVTVEYDSTSDAQRWKIEKVGSNYMFINKKTGKAMNAGIFGSVKTDKKNTSDKSQQWTLSPIALMD